MTDIEHDDLLFTDSPDAGTPQCICSRCGQPIPETEVPIRVWPNPNPAGVEYRYHGRCLGLIAGEEPDNYPFDEEQLIELEERNGPSAGL